MWHKLEYSEALSWESLPKMDPLVLYFECTTAQIHNILNALTLGLNAPHAWLLCTIPSLNEPSYLVQMHRSKPTWMLYFSSYDCLFTSSSGIVYKEQLLSIVSNDTIYLTACLMVVCLPVVWDIFFWKHREDSFRPSIQWQWIQKHSDWIHFQCQVCEGDLKPPQEVF